MYPSRLIRKKFLEYFKKNNHEIINSSSLIPENDPTLLFTNAGMVQFKNILTGDEESRLKKVATSQKCIRAGGKHNDLENVGYTLRHQTFFEMLGNFSFGDYFKEEAIFYAWDLLINEYKVDKKKLLITVFSEDSITKNIWRKITGLSSDKIISVNSKDNFWSMGDTGPCGPCTEIFYDYGDKISGSISNKGIVGDRFVEIWNLVFMEFNQIDKNKRLNLPKKSVDTGMGLERISALLQKTNDNYKTDIFKEIINSIAKLSKSENKNNKNISHRIIADHIRASCHLISEGILPSNEGRGYVLRRIMRRGMRHAHILGCSEPIFYKLAPLVIKEMGNIFPELKRAESLIIETLNNEESRFKETIDRGLKILNDEIKKTKNKKLSGNTAFLLYDTYGFPLDLTQDIVKDLNISVDLKTFEKQMEEQKKKARSAWKGSGDVKTNKLWFEIFKKYGSTEFVGYKNLKTQGSIIQIIKNNKSINKIKQGDKAIIMTNQTAFYGESGGQIGDRGVIKFNNNEFKVLDTKKILKIHLHYGEVLKGEFKKKEEVNMIVDNKKRESIEIYHSATHLLHASLRKVLGDHVTQKGSLVSFDRLRFDFSHPKSLTDSDIEKIENVANKIIKQNDKVNISIISYEKAIEKGAMALFGEKYEDEVRVISMGKENNNTIFSMELCGGTHVNKTSDINNIKIIKQSSVAAGIKRIEALSGNDLLNYIKGEKGILLVREQEKENKKIKENLEEKKKNLSLEDPSKNIVIEGKENSIKYYFRTILDYPPNDLPKLLDKLKIEIKSGIIILFGVHEKNISIVVGVTDSLLPMINAVDIVKKVSVMLGGKGGGGRSNFARAGGGNDKSKIPKACNKIKELIKSF
jgi:alanyl-tRNA synthetase